MVACASKQLKREQKSYSATELECLAVVQMLKKFRVYLLGRHFILNEDHKPLLSLLSLAEPRPKLARWIMEISEYSFTIKHQAGKKIAHADALSRMPTVNIVESSENFELVWDKRRIAAEQQSCEALQPFLGKQGKGEVVTR